MNTANSSTPTTRPKVLTIFVSLLLDVVFVIIFTAIGRGSHAREATLVGLWQTSWPFLVAVLVAWLVCRTWKQPLSLPRAGLPVWLITAGLGLCIRIWATDSTAAVPFIVVTFLTLCLFLLGWRLIARLLRAVLPPSAPKLSTSQQK